MRESLHECNTIVIKAGTSVVSNEDGTPSLVRLSGIVEQASELMTRGKRVILVTSGAVGCGRTRLRKQFALSTSLRQLQQRNKVLDTYDSACAAAGQLTLMSLYQTLFSFREFEASQFLVTQTDFEDETRRQNLRYAIMQILQIGMVPIVNENDAVSANKGYDVDDSSFSDNDGLAALMAQLCDASLLILLSDVAGLYSCHPSTPGARLISRCTPKSTFTLGKKSERGRGGMHAKVACAFRALDLGVNYVALASGHEPGVILKLVDGYDVGTVFTQHEEEKKQSVIEYAREARAVGRRLQAASAQIRTAMLLAIADALEAKSADILKANKADVDASLDCARALKQRLGLSEAKLRTLSAGARSLAGSPDPVDEVLERRQLAADGLILEKRATPLGVVLVIFESRPDALVQIACLALRAGCALLLKGGSEAKHSNAALKQIIDEAIAKYFDGPSPISLLSSRQAVHELLAHPESTSLVDLVVPRGSNQLVRSIQSSTKIPVLGHADGICHAYVHEDANFDKCVAVLIDSKTDYPAACNSLDSLLVHDNFPRKADLLAELHKANISLVAGPAATSLLPDYPEAESLSKEYGDLTMLVQVVHSLNAAVDFINSHSSAHTDTVLTESAEVANFFQRNVDSACVFHNASTRFADGFRFGLGAELGVATGRLHARGPVGIQGFLTYKWLLNSDSFHTQQQFAKKLKSYTHEQLFPPPHNAT